MLFEITGKLVKGLPITEGDSTNGHWMRSGIVIETMEEYSKQIAFTVFGQDNVTALGGLAVGNQVVVNFSPESREYNGRWYTDLRAFSVNKEQQPQVVNAQNVQQIQQPHAQMPQKKQGDLPF